VQTAERREELVREGFAEVSEANPTKQKGDKMSHYCIELDRPGEDGLSIPMEDFRQIADTVWKRGGPSLLRIAEGDGGTVTANQGRVIADAISDRLSGDWPTETIHDFLAFLRRGSFQLAKACLGFPAEYLN
jgi:hypothetical protein